jgi:hypothetical protein
MNVEMFVADLSSQAQVRRLANLLLDRLERSAPARVVTVTSNAHTTGRIDFDDLHGELSYSGGRAYGLQARQGLVHLSAGQKNPWERSSRQRAASRRSADILRSGGPRMHPATPPRPPATRHEVASSGRCHVDPPDVSSRARGGVGSLLREPASHKIIHSQQQPPGGRSTALEASANLVGLSAAPSV